MPLENKEILLIGYSGHSYVIVDAIHSQGGRIKGYCDIEPKSNNPFNLSYLGQEDSLLLQGDWIVAIGDNYKRKEIFNKYQQYGNSYTARHKSSIVGYGVVIGKGSFVSANVTINALSRIGVCSILNTGSVIEHECVIGDFSHLAPGAVLAGNVSVGNQTFIGANAVVKQGISIGNNVVIGAGSVVLKDVPNGVTVVGNPGRVINRQT